MKIIKLIPYLGALFGFTAPFATADTRLALFCEDDKDEHEWYGGVITYKGATGTVRPCFLVPDYYYGEYDAWDCDLYKWSGKLDGFSAYDNFCFAATYLVNCDVNHYGHKEYAGICYFNTYKHRWEWIDDSDYWCDSKSEAVYTVVEDGHCLDEDYEYVIPPGRRGLKAKVGNNGRGKGPPIDVSVPAAQFEKYGEEGTLIVF
uniref:Uncharacterized protein n=1 Tax=Amphora coffeiformis TaxID=265554 RepID=A0A6S8PLD0_9STRA|mmetsp:Transcript_3847/g.7400  ORF Transcript_3847/g.7400 Transcript_3847/m.7400 type:complete len:203 (-) Transcript_3847:127-735(-)|eukprot:scaffold401_cov152-Amphora_coffeaeformis.AAC.3